MKISCEKNVLIEKLMVVSRAVAVRTPKPVLECVLLKCTEGRFDLLANDGSLAIESQSIPSTVIEPGAVALEAKLFLDIVRHLPENTVEIQSDDNFVTIITSGDAEFKILGISSEEFPTTPVIEENKSFHVPFHQLKDMIRQTIFSVAIDESRPAFTGELIEVKEGWFHVVAVDGFRVSHRKIAIESDMQLSLIVPPKALNELYKINTVEENTDIAIYYTDKHIMFHLESFYIVSVLIHGEFINYENAFTEDHTTLITVNKHLFLSSLERVSVIASKEMKKNPIKLNIQNDLLICSSQTETGNVTDRLMIENDGQDLEISFNPKYLIDAVKALDYETITLQFSSPVSPCIIKELEDQNARYLVLPLRIRS